MKHQTDPIENNSGGGKDSAATQVTDAKRLKEEDIQKKYNEREEKDGTTPKMNAEKDDLPHDSTPSEENATLTPGDPLPEDTLPASRTEAEKK